MQDPRRPSFSIVIPLYNEERFAAEAISSALNQSVRELQVVIVDDGSTDGTPEVIAGFDDPRIDVVRQENRGLAAARNAGIERARAEYIGLLDGDDLFMPEYAATMIAALDSNPGAGFAFVDGWRYVESEARFRRASAYELNGGPAELPDDPERMLDALLENNFVLALSTLRRSAFDAVGGFEENLRSCEDYDLWLRMLIAGYSGIMAPGKQLIQRERPGQMTGNTDTMLHWLAVTFDRVAENPRTPPRSAATAAAKAEAVRHTMQPGLRRRLERRLVPIAVKLKHRLLRERLLMPEPPAAVVEAFPRFTVAR